MGICRPCGTLRAAFKSIVFLLILGQILPVFVRRVSAEDGEAVVRLTWISPGDDLNWGRAYRYDIRYSPYYITPENWSSAVQAGDEPIPKSAGTVETYIVADLEMGAYYYFAIKSSDEAGNWSGLSNVIRIKAVSVYTCGDVTGGGGVGVSDAVYLINYIFLGSDSPKPMASGDIDCNGMINVCDATILINYVFGNGKAPCDPNADGIPEC